MEVCHEAKKGLRSIAVKICRNRFSFWVAVLLVWAFPVWVKAGESGSPFSPKMLSKPLWDDGLAEYSVYTGKEVRYGIPRETEIRHIIVKETFAPGGYVKTDDWKQKGAFQVIKLNQVIGVPTGSYRYDQMHSSFWKVETGALIKFSLASIDSCGNSYKEARFTPEGAWDYRAYTYWEGMDAAWSKVEPPEGALFYDELPFRLRMLDWGSVTEFEAPLMKTVVSSKADALQFEKARFTLNKEGDTFEVSVRSKGGQDLFIFDKKEPYILRKWKKADGGELTLKTTVRIPYWKLNKPGDGRALSP